MKKLLSILLVLVLSFAFFGCNTGTATDEPLVEMQEIQAVGTVNLADELSLFSKVLDNNYINVKIKIREENVPSYSNERTYDVKAKRTAKGYDIIIIATMEDDETDSVGKIFYVDGNIVQAYAPNGKDFQYKTQGQGVYFVDLMSSYNAQINADTKSKLIYHVLKPILHKYVEIKETLEYREFEEDYESTIELLEKNRSQSIHDFVLKEILGVVPSNVEDVTKIKDGILEFCSGNPSIATFIDKIESYINTLVSEENKIDIKAYVNDLQKRSGVTTQEFVVMARENIPNIADNLRDANEGEGIYDYIRSYLRVISLNTFVKEVIGVDMPFVDFVNQQIEQSKQISVEYAFNWVVSNTFKKENGPNGLVIGEHLDALLKNPFNFKEAYSKFEVKVDDKGRPTKIKIASAMVYDERDIVQDRISHGTRNLIEITINYNKTNTRFALPEEYLNENL